MDMTGPITCDTTKPFTAYSKDKNTKWMGGSGSERRRFCMERDSLIISQVNTYEVVTCELVAALLGLERTHSNLNIIERRLRLLADQKHFRQVQQDGITYTVSFSLSLR